jgi:hypothetical protein
VPPFLRTNVPAFTVGKSGTSGALLFREARNVSLGTTVIAMGSRR